MILFIVDVPTPQRAPTLDDLQRRGLPLRVYYLSAGTGDRGWGAVSLGHENVVLHGWREHVQLLRDLLAPRPDAVCIFGYRGRARAMAAVVARARGVPLVVRSDSNVDDEVARPRHRRALKRTYLRLLLGSPEIWTIGRQNDAYWSLLGFRDRWLIPYTVPEPPGGAEHAEYLRSRICGATPCFVFAFVGRLLPWKGVTEAIEAFHRVRARHQDVRLLVAGHGPLSPVIDGAGDGLHWLGAVPYDELGAVYRAADCVVVPSHEEPWGLVVNEALLLGTPVIASHRVAAAVDLVVGDRGQQVPVRDVDALAHAMLAELKRGRRRVEYEEPCAADLMEARLRSLTRPAD